MRDWIKAIAEQVAAWFVQVKSWRIWLPLLIGLIAGLLIGGLTAPAQTSSSTSSPSQNITSGWPGLVLGALLGVIVALGFEWLSKVAAQVAARRPLSKVLGPLATQETTVYVGPFARPLDSKLFRLDRIHPFAEKTAIVGTELVVGYGDTVALSYIYATLLKSGKRSSEIIINQDADLQRGRWGINFITIGAANARTMEVLECFQSTYYTFDDNFSSIVRAPKAIDATAPCKRDDGTLLEISYRNKVVCEGRKDYGFILKLKDGASDERNRIFVIAGLGGDGTAGAAFYLWRNYTALAQMGDTFGVLIESNAGPESAHLVDFDKVATLRRVR